MATEPLPTDLLAQARLHPADSASRTNLLLEALVLASLPQPKPRASRNSRPTATEKRPDA